MQVFTRGNSWQAGPWAGAHHRHRVAISFGEKRWARPVWRRLQPPAGGSFQRREGGGPSGRGRSPGVSEAEPEGFLWSGAAGRAQRLGWHP